MVSLKSKNFKYPFIAIDLEWWYLLGSINGLNRSI